MLCSKVLEFIQKNNKLQSILSSKHTKNSSVQEKKKPGNKGKFALRTLPMSVLSLAFNENTLS